MITRTQYLNGDYTHDEYYSQFIDERTTRAVKHYIGIDELKNSKDEHMNDIPLHHWDRIAFFVDKEKFKEVGDTYSPAGAVCVAKATARDILKTNL